MLNRRFGKLIVIEQAPSHNWRTYWVCKCDCGNITKPVVRSSLTGGNTRSCGCLQREVAADGLKGRQGAKHPNWKGGRHITRDGYIKVRVNGKYQLEHVLVMEQHLGRSLFPDETVHHKNSIRDDNRLDNLEIRVKGKHPHGASVSDLLEWADELIKRYR